MKFRHKLLLSVCAGFLAMLLYSGPMWWGVLFSPITQSLARPDPPGGPLPLYIQSSISHPRKCWGPGIAPRPPAMKGEGESVRTDYLRRRLTRLKCSLVSLATSGQRAIRAIRLGMAMRPLRVSAMFQAICSSIMAPMMTKNTKKI